MRLSHGAGRRADYGYVVGVREKGPRGRGLKGARVIKKEKDI
jgi:hypothetical protein